MNAPQISSLLTTNQSKIITLLRNEYPQSLAIYAFGSQVQGFADRHSDLDLALLVGGYADPVQLWHSAQQIADMVDCSVDLLDMRAASTVMQYQVLISGQCLWALQPAAGLFECYVLTEKTRLDEARKLLLDEIQAQGKVYVG